MVGQAQVIVGAEVKQIPPVYLDPGVHRGFDGPDLGVETHFFQVVQLLGNPGGVILPVLFVVFAHGNLLGD